MDDSNKYAIAIMAALLFIVAGILLFVSGYNMLQLESIGRSSVSEFYYNADGIANIGWGIFCFAMATILIPIANHSFETSLNLAEQKTILLEKMNQLEKLPCPTNNDY